MLHVNWNRQLGLAITLLTLGFGAYWLEYKYQPDHEAAEEQSKHLFSLKDQAVQSITLNDGNRKFVFKCMDDTSKLCKPGDQSHWELTEPIKLKADDSNLNTFVSALSTLSAAETIDLKGETPEKQKALLKEYGVESLLPSSKQVQVTTSSGTTTLFLGNIHPIGESIFSIKNKQTQQVYLIPSFFKTNFEHELTYWRDKKLFSLGAHEVQSFQLQGTEHSSGMRKDGQWILKSNTADDLTGDPEAMDHLLSGAIHLSAKNFASNHQNDEKAKAILKGLPVVLTLTLQKEKTASETQTPAPIVLKLYQKKAPKTKEASQKSASPVYATVSNLDPVFELDSGAAQRLNKTIKDLRLTKLVTSIERFTAKRLAFTGAPLGPTPIVLTQQGDKWPSSKKVQDLLDRLSGNRIQAFLDGKTTPAEAQGIQVEIGDEQTPKKKHLLFWQIQGKLYARDLQSKKSEIYLIDPMVRDVLPWSKDYFKEEPPVNASPIKESAPKK
jgi:hypothetical protein